MPENILTTLNNCIRREFHIDKKNGNKIYIEEKQNKNQKGTCKKIEFSTIGKVFVMTLEREDFVTVFKPSEKGLYKRCDGIIFNIYKNNLIIFLVELKSKTKSGFLDQFISTKNFITYVIEQLKLFKTNFNVTPQYIGLLFSKRKQIKKQTTKKGKIEFEEKRGLKYIECYCTNQAYNLIKVIKSL
ncbi:hypothetical protein [Nautilia sp.]